MKKMFMVVLMIMLFVGCAGVTPDIFPAPDEPDGPKWSYTNKEVVFETEGTDPIDVHEYQWDLGDGIEEEPNLSDWDDDGEEIKYIYSDPGIYEVRVREQCPLKLFRSPWSDERKITIIERKPKTVGQLIMSLFS